MEPIRTVYHSLNGIRGIAAIAVVLFHAEPFIGDLAPSGYLAVDLFFVLSGFVIAAAYGDRLAKGLEPTRFMEIRLRRFYPPYLAGLIIGAGWIALELMFKPPAALTWQEWALALMAGLFFLPTVPGTLYPLNVPAWSLLFELVINAWFAAFYRWLSAPVLIGTALGSLGLLLWLAPDTLNLGADLTTAHFGLLRTAFAFPIGVLIYRARERIPAIPLPAVIPTALVCLPLFLPSSLWLDYLAVVFIFPAGIALCSRVEPRNPAIFEALGRLSYPLYAVHWPLLQIALGLA